MKARRVILAGLLGFLFTSTLLSSQSYGQQRELIRIRGSNVMAGMCVQWANAYMEANPAVTVLVSGGDTSAGLEALFEKRAELAMASRDILEKELQAAALSNTKPVKIDVCREAVAFITHPSNPVSELTTEQLGWILRGNISDWGEVGGPNQPIKKVVYTETSGAALFLRHRVMEDDYFDSEAVARDRFTFIVTEVARSTPFAIAFVPRLDGDRAARGKQVKVLGIKERKDSPPVHATEQSLKDGSYPLVLPVFFYWDSETVTLEVRRFVDFCKSRCPTGK
jgi:phosphate transport system substrate-binding protein